MIVMNKEGRVLLGERYGQSGVWQFPQGGIDEGEPVEHSVMRELQEELGIDPALLKIERRLEAVNQYEFRDPPPYAVGRWAGQRQVFFWVRFFGSDRDIRLDLHAPEFQTFRWCELDEVLTRVEPIRVAGYTGALREIERLVGKAS